MTLDSDTLTQARRLYAEKDYGVLSTISVHLDGFPFGSVVPYAVDGEGRPTIFLSDIAQHSKNLASDDRCSLTILENAGGNVQAESRLTISGHVEVIEDDPAAAKRYERYFPESVSYRQAHDFRLYRLRPTMLRFIGGFGRIHWIEPWDFFLPSPFDAHTESYIIDHMNSDHRPSLRSYFRHFMNRPVSEDAHLEMCGIDSTGFDVRLGEGRFRFHSPRPMKDANEARTVLVEMSKEAGQSL